MSSPIVLVVTRSRGGRTRLLADAIVAGVGHRDLDGAVDVRVCDPLACGPDDVLTSDAVVIATPEHFGYMAGAVKHFFEEIYHPCLDHTVGLPWGLVVSAGNDGRGTVTSIERIVTGLQWRQATDHVVVVGEPGDADLEAARELGATVAASLVI